MITNTQVQQHVITCASYKQKVRSKYKDPEESHRCDCYQSTLSQHYRLHLWFSADFITYVITQR